MPNSPHIFSALSFRAQREICFFLLLLGISASTLSAQVQRPKILGVGRVRIEGTTAYELHPIRFYSELGLGMMGSFQAGATTFTMFAVNDHQEIDLVAGPRPQQPPGTPLPCNLSEVLFETSDIVALHDYLASKQLKISDVSTAPGQVMDSSGKSVMGDASLFYLQDPDGHSIGFIQYKLPLKYKPQEGQVTSRLIHAGLIVHDRPAMEHFYKDILGFRPYWHGGRRDDGTDDWVSFQVSDGTDWIEFMLNVPDNADKHLRGVMNHIALGVTDIQAAKAQLIKNGLTLTEEPKIGRDGKWQLNLYDPDDTRIEFMEFIPKGKTCCSEFTGPHPKP